MTHPLLLDWIEAINILKSTTLIQDGWMVVKSDRTRSQILNQTDALEKLRQVKITYIFLKLLIFCVKLAFFQDDPVVPDSSTSHFHRRGKRKNEKRPNKGCTRKIKTEEA